MKPELSIVIPSRWRADLLRACLASVVRYAPSGTEIIVVDDASPQGSISSTASTFPGVEIVRLLRPRGFCVAANAGIKRAKGRIVELLNDDTQVLPNWAPAALRCFANDRIGAVAPLVLWPAEKPNAGVRIDSAGDRYYMGGVARKRGHGEPLCERYLHPCRVFGASASSAFYRREALQLVGGLPEEFGAYFEDVDLSFRLNRAGYQVRYEPASRVLHWVSSSHGTHGRRLLEQQALNEERVFWRNIPSSLLGRAVPKHLAVLAAKALRRWDEGNLAPFLTGRLRILGELPALLRYRQQLRETGEKEDAGAWQIEECWQ